MMYCSIQGTPDVEEVIDECLISREKPVIKDFTSPIWQKTAIAVVTEKSQENKENEADTLNSSVKKDKVGIPRKELNSVLSLNK